MIKEVRLVVSPTENADLKAIINRIEKSLSPKEKEQLSEIKLIKRSIDARGRQVKYNLLFHVYIGEKPEPLLALPENKVKEASPVHIIGFGPGGMFAALQAIENGMKPVVFERGKKVRDRRRDLVDIIQELPCRA